MNPADPIQARDPFAGPLADPRHCEVCGRLFQPPRDNVRRGRGKTCSIKCRCAKMAGCSPYPPRPLPDRFWSKVDKAAARGCWRWTGARGVNGYGHLWVARQWVYAHRVAWILTHGPIPDDLFVLHDCDNPPCVNPSHLFLGTNTDNMVDAAQKARLGRHSIKVSDDDVREIRATYSTEQRNGQLLADRYAVSNSTIRRIARGGNRHGRRNRAA